MKIRKFMGVCLLALSVGLPSAQADVYWADEPDTLVGNRTLDSRSSFTGPTVRQVLSESSDRDIQRAYQNPAGTDGLYLLLRDESGVWHRGGRPPATHVTVELWDRGRYQTTCHVYSYREDRDRRFFYTTCN
ncbi:hypothetical protein PsAD46_04274 [Pseudovibrio sp. Ad46]|uniref:hypothetical protein n=1 Tax=Pseudovibrio sp. Ad46 TaxID=989432 RepID=UPI0007B2505F|nr:hypothetical protein [Pseudovibrio sp. Ad46]KZK79562.1 hypothetical protein PsAD46_04274 [Pseudovibrio sp. Ad46]